MNNFTFKKKVLTFRPVPMLTATPVRCTATVADRLHPTWHRIWTLVELRRRPTIFITTTRRGTRPNFSWLLVEFVLLCWTPKPMDRVSMSFRFYSLLMVYNCISRSCSFILVQPPITLNTRAKAFKFFYSYTLVSNEYIYHETFCWLWSCYLQWSILNL